MSETAHHPIFSGFGVADVEEGQDCFWDFLGVRTRGDFVEWQGAGHPPALPPFDEEYFEWVDVLEAVACARDEFVMVELGAGYGRWLARAVAALRVANPMAYRLVAVEAEPTHFHWLEQHLADNGVDLGRSRLIQAAISGDGGKVPFHMGNPREWYGQAIAQGVKRIGWVSSAWNALRGNRQRSLRWVRSVTLRQVLQGFEKVDLIDLDVQAAEADVLESAPSDLDRKVARLHIGTHSHEIEERLRALFGKLGWRNLNDYPCLGKSETPYGLIEFGDGVQSWLNPRFEGEARG